MGLDENGFVATISRMCTTQTIFEPLVATAMRLSLAAFKDNLHSAYLYGSVARGEAVAEKSDLDLILLLSSDPDDAEILQRLKSDIYEAANGLVTKVDIDLLPFTEAMEPDSLYGWGFWLKHCSRNILGDDIANDMALFKPDIRIARGVNGDVLEVARRYVQDVSMAEDDLKKILFREISKKVTRALASSVAHKEPCWIADFALCQKLASKHYPKLAQPLETVFRVSQSGEIPSASHLDLILSLAAQANEYLDA